MTKIKKKTSQYVKQSSLQPTSYKTHFLRASNETMNQKRRAEKVFKKWIIEYQTQVQHVNS
jgi:hypothetical protein